MGGRSIPVKISPTLLSQIRFLCSEIEREEWSGVLLYSIEGEFGTPEFEITAREVFLMDIGSAAYTEYSMNDPAFISFMMRNREALQMKKGHIHSHNIMSSFFSGTDCDELVQNSEFYNYYLSLIVNNAGQMIARVAFRSKVQTTTVCTYTYKGSEGQSLSSSTESYDEEDVVLFFNCDVTMEITEEFKKRKDKLQEQKTRRLEEKPKQSTIGFLSNNTLPEKIPGNKRNRKLRRLEKKREIVTDVTKTFD